MKNKITLIILAFFLITISLTFVNACETDGDCTPPDRCSPETWECVTPVCSNDGDCGVPYEDEPFSRMCSLNYGTYSTWNTGGVYEDVWNYARIPTCYNNDEYNAYCQDDYGTTDNPFLVFNCGETCITNSEGSSYCIDFTTPIVNITYPINNTNYTTAITELNYTDTYVDEVCNALLSNCGDPVWWEGYLNGTNRVDYAWSPLDYIQSKSCWYSTNKGVTNSSGVTSGENFTGLTSVVGMNNWTIYCQYSITDMNSVAHTKTGSQQISFLYELLGEEEFAPTIPEIYPISAVTLNGGTTKDIVVQFNVTDPNGFADIDFSSPNVSVTSGITTRTSTLCNNVANYTSTNTSTISCNLTFYFYDEAGYYNISVSVADEGGNSTTNTTNNFFQVNALDYVTQNLNYINFTNLYVGTNDNEASNTITITNGGNQNYNNFSMMAKNLTGNVYSNKISATQFSVSNLTGQTTGQTYLKDSSYKSIPIFNFNRHGSSISEMIYFYVDVPTGLRADKYLSDASWSLKLENN